MILLHILNHPYILILQNLMVKPINNRIKFCVIFMLLICVCMTLFYNTCEPFGGSHFIFYIKLGLAAP
jgi:hypothetical protein